MSHLGDTSGCRIWWPVAFRITSGRYPDILQMGFVGENVGELLHPKVSIHTCGHRAF